MNTLPGWVPAALAVTAVSTAAAAICGFMAISHLRTDARADGGKRHEAQVYATIGADASKAGDLDMAGSAYSAALEVAPDDAALKAALTQVHVDQILQRPEVITAANAIRLQLELSAALVANADQPRAMVAYGKVLLFRGFTKPARDRLTEAAKAKPDLTEAHLYLGEAQLVLKEWLEAEKALEAALKLKPGDGRALWALGKSLAAREKWEQAVKHLDKAAEKLDDAAVWLDLGRAETKREKWPAAEAALSRAPNLRPDLVAIWPLYATALKQNKKLVPAAQLFTRYYDKTGDWGAYAEMGDCFMQLKQWKKAVQVYRELRKVKQQDPDIECRLGFTYESLGQLLPAHAAFQRCAKKATGIEGHERTLGAANTRVEALAKKITAAKEAKGAP